MTLMVKVDNMKRQLGIANKESKILRKNQRDIKNKIFLDDSFILKFFSINMSDSEIMSI